MYTCISLPFSITLAVCSLFGLFGPRKYHLPPPTPPTSYALSASRPAGKNFFLQISNTLRFLAFFFFFFAATLSYAAATIRFFKRALIDSSNVLEYIPLSKEREREDCNKNVIRGTKESVIRAGSRLGNDPKWIRDWKSLSSEFFPRFFFSPSTRSGVVIAVHDFNRRVGSTRGAHVPQPSDYIISR